MSTSVTSGSPRTAAICASVSIVTDDALSSSTECGCAAELVRAGARSSPTCRSVRASAPSPVPSHRRRPRRCSGPRRRTGRGRSAPARGPRYSPPAGNGRGVKVPIPPVMTMARHSMRMPCGRRHRERAVRRRARARPPGGRAGSRVRTARPARVTARPGRAPGSAGKPATSKIAFSGYIAVIWPPGSSSESSTAVDSGPDACVVGTEQADRPGADDEQIDRLRGGVRHSRRA